MEVYNIIVAIMCHALQLWHGAARSEATPCGSYGWGIQWAAHRRCPAKLATSRRARRAVRLWVNRYILQSVEIGWPLWKRCVWKETRCMFLAKIVPLHSWEFRNMWWFGSTSGNVTSAKGLRSSFEARQDEDGRGGQIASSYSLGIQKLSFCFHFSLSTMYQSMRLAWLPIIILCISVYCPSLSFPRFEMFQTFAGFIAGKISFGRAQLDTMLNAGQATKRCPQWRRGNPSGKWWRRLKKYVLHFSPSYLMIIGRNRGESIKSNVSNVFYNTGENWDAVLVLLRAKNYFCVLAGSGLPIQHAIEIQWQGHHLRGWGQRNLHKAGH